MKLALADPIAQTKLAAAAISTSSGAGAVLAIVKDWVTELFGVPLPVLLAAATGAFGVRTYLPAATLIRALLGSGAWTLVGTYSAQLGLSVASAVFNAQVPATAIAGVALLFAALGQLAAPVVIQRLPGAIGAWFDKRSGKPGGGEPK